MGPEQHLILYAQEGVQKTVAHIQASFRMCTKLYSFDLRKANVIEDVDEWLDCKLLILTPSLAHASFPPSSSALPSKHIEDYFFSNNFANFCKIELKPLKGLVIAKTDFRLFSRSTMKQYPKSAYVLANLWNICFLMSLENNGIIYKKRENLTPSAIKL